MMRFVNNYFKRKIKIVNKENSLMINFDNKFKTFGDTEFLRTFCVLY